MGYDAPPDRYSPMKGFSVALSVDKPAEADRIFKELSAGGQVWMPMEQTFFAPRFGMLLDQFGTPRMISAKGPEAKLKLTISNSDIQPRIKTPARRPLSAVP